MKNIYEAIAKEYADHELDTIYYTVKAAVLYGLQKGCEIEREKAGNIGRTDEELVKEIIRILKTKEVVDFSGGTFLDDSDFGFVAKEIAKLLPSSRCQENDLNVELLEASIIARDRMFKESGSCPREVVIAITNYEKQTKP